MDRAVHFDSLYIRGVGACQIQTYLLYAFLAVFSYHSRLGFARTHRCTLDPRKKECMDHGSCASGHLDMFLQQIIYSFYKYSPGEKPKTEAQILSRSGKVSKCHDLHMAKPHLT